MKEHILIVLVPLILANCLHMAVVKQNLFPALQIPLSTGLFGKNKTIRGFIILPLLNGFFLSALALIYDLLVYQNSFVTGLLLGCSYLFFELPNSFLKRRLGIASGESAPGNRHLFMLLDKSDSAFGVMLVYWLISGIPARQALLLFFICSGTHFFLSWLLVRIKLKNSF